MYMWNLKTLNSETVEWWLSGIEAWGKLRDVGQRVQFQLCRMNKALGNSRYSIVTVVNNIVFCI